MADLAALYSDHALWAWIALGAALLAIEVMTGSGWLLWAAAAAAVTGLLAEFAGLSFVGALLAFALLTIVSSLLARRYFPRSLAGPAGDINDNVARLVGHQGRTVAPFQGRVGRVAIDGKEWAAELDGSEAIETGARVEVVGVQGASLRVRAV